MTPAPPLSARADRPTRSRSLRTQLVAWNILALALLLAILGGVIRYTVHRTIMASVNQDLERQIGPPGGPPPRAPAPPQFQGDGPLPNGPPDDGPPGQDAPPPRRDGGRRGRDDAANPYHPRMFDLQGQPLHHDHPFQPWDADALTRAKAGSPVYSDVTTADGVPLRVLSRLLAPGGPSRGLVQAAYPLTDVQRAMRGVDSALLILIPVALICAGLAGAALTDRVLGRVRQMTQAAGRISGQNFSARLPVTGQDEFSELAATFNGMLGRQEDAFQQQRRLIEQQRRFTADASHELKTPLTIIKGNTSMALGVPPDPADFCQSMQDIDRAADTMQRLVQDLLLLARSDSGQLARDNVELLVRDILARAISGSARRDAAPIHLSVADESLSVCGTEDELVRLFGNLLTNAARHTPPDGRIAVEAKRQGANAVISVTDTGPGIAPEHLPHLGERFYRVDSARARLDGGTGLGLSICRGIAEAHGGIITFQSTVGVGTTVFVSLPPREGPQGPKTNANNLAQRVDISPKMCQIIGINLGDTAMSRPMPHRLSRRQRQIMDAVYRLEQATAAQIHAALPDAPSPTAVRTLITILEKDGHLQHIQEGKHFVYSPTQPRQSAARSAVQQLVQTFFGGSIECAVTTMLSEAEANLTGEELARLGDLIARAKAGDVPSRPSTSEIAEGEAQ